MTNSTVQDLVAAAKAEVPAISCDGYRALRAGGESHVLIDVRKKEEFDAGHIEGAVNIPRGVLEFKIGEAVPNKSANVIVQCASGGRSALCGQALRALGYANARNLEGGYAEWCKVKG